MPPQGGLTGTQIATKNYIEFAEFETMDTQAARYDLPPNRLAWCENLQIFNKNQLRVISGSQLSSNNTGAGPTIVRQFGAHGFAFLFAFMSDGSLVAYNIGSNAVVPVAPAGTFTNPDFTVWEGAVVGTGVVPLLLINDPKAGYCAWNGNMTSGLIVRAGTVSPFIRITNGGSGYVAPTATITGGSGAGATCTVTQVGGVITNIALNNPGSGFKAGDVLTVTITGAPGVGATATAIIWPILTALAPPAVPTATLAVFAGRVWLAAGRVLLWTGTTGPDDSNPANAAGQTTLSDFDLVLNITALRALNNFLWIFGDQSIKQIGTVSVSGSTTIFTIVTLSSDQGTTFPFTIMSYSRLVLFANRTGIFAVLGSSVQKISHEMDLVWNGANFTALVPQAFLADLNGSRIYCILVQAFDPYLATTRNLILMFQEKRWYVATQNSFGGGAGVLVAATYIANGDGTLTAWGTNLAAANDFTVLLQGGANPAPIRLLTAQSTDGKKNMSKKVLRGGAMQNAIVNFTMTVTIDTENGSDSESYAVSGAGNVQWRRFKANGTGIAIGLTFTATVAGSGPSAGATFQFYNAAIEYQDTTVMASTVAA